MADGKILTTREGLTNADPLVTTSGELRAVAFEGYGAQPAAVRGHAADGAAAVGVALDNVGALADAGAKLLSVRNAGVEKAYLGPDGDFHGYGVWDDIFGDASQGVGNAALDYEAYRDTPYKAYFFRSGQADELNWRFQMSHRWDPTTDVKFHLHIIPMVNPPTVPLVFAVKGTYAWSTFGADFPAASGWTPFTGTATIGLTDAFKQKIMACFTATPPVGAHESAFLLINMARDTTGTDTYTTSKSGGTAGSNVCLLGADVHYRAPKLGTSADPGA